jgi:hypothetical protein
MLCEAMRRIAIVAEEGLEPIDVTSLEQNKLRRSAKSIGAKCGALAASTGENEGNNDQSESTHDVRLRRLIAVWPQLPEHIKLAVEALCFQTEFRDTSSVRPRSRESRSIQIDD